jgi:hypothetical protein
MLLALIRNDELEKAAAQSEKCKQILQERQNSAEEEFYQYPERMLEIPQIQLSFEDRANVADHAYETIRSLGLRFRGKNAWPQFQSFRPGYAPWRLEKDEMRTMAAVLEQVLEVAPRVRSDPGLLESEDPEVFLVRVPSGDGENVWQDEYRRFSPVTVENVAAPVPELDLARLNKLERSSAVLEVDFFMTPAMIGEKGTRMLNGYALMAVEDNQGMVIGLEVLTAEPDVLAMRGMLPTVLAQHLLKAGLLPSGIVIRYDLLGDLLYPFSQALGCELYQSEVLPNLDPAKQDLIDHLSGGF